jgi:hypothetical protein
LNSAIANATYAAEQQNIAIDPDGLWVKSCFVDMGPTKNRRRMRPAPQGRAYREQRHYCHITIQVTSEEQAKSEKELKGIAAKAKRDAAKKAEGGEVKAKAPAKKAAPKKAKVEKVDAAETPIEETVETPTRAENATTVETKGDAEVADAKNVETQTTAALNEPKPADEKQQDINEELERQ